MGLDLWFREDVARILGAAYEAMSLTAAAGEPEAGYRAGFGAALRAVAMGFGVADPGRGADAGWREPEVRRPAREATVAARLDWREG